MINPEQVKILVNAFLKEQNYTPVERVMFTRYFLYDTFKSFMPLRRVAEMTDITNPSTVSLQIKKLNSNPRYHLTILKIRNMINELRYI